MTTNEIIKEILDRHVDVTGYVVNADNIKSNDIIFAIPFSSIRNFTPVDSSFYKIDISNSSFSLGYKNKLFNENNINEVNFYLRTLSGRCISSNCQWNALISFQF